MRNSVKAVIDSYDGTVKLYVVDPSDPIVSAYQKAFPALFLSVDEMPQELRAHWRYPEDLFRLQTNMYGRYHITDPQSFYEKTSAWAVANDPGTSVSGSSTTAAQTATQLLSGQPTSTATNRIDPFYQLLQLPGETQESFVMSRPFVPFSETQSSQRQTLTSFMVAKSDPDDYGKIIVYEMPSGQQVDGPTLANTQIQQNQVVSSLISLLNQQGSRVQLGNMLLVPLENTILYVRPLYVSADANSAPQLQQVIVVSGSQVAMRPTLREAIQLLYPGSNPETVESRTIRQLGATSGTDTSGSSSGTTTTTTPGGSTTTTVPPADGLTVDQLVAKAVQALNEADAARLSGDLGTYQAKVTEAQGYLDQAQALVSSSSPTTAPASTAPSTTVPSTISPTTTIAGTPA